jgi:RNA polymerase sigma factor (TIGR02999 family)
MTQRPSITRLLIDWSNGNRAALEELTPRVYEELHSLARTYLNRDRPNQTLQPAALVNEIYLRLIDQSQPIQWEGRSHFFGIAARLMRRVLVDYARAHRAVKRGGYAIPVTLKETMAFSSEPVTDILAVDEALTRLAQIDERKAKIIELRYFAGMTFEETAHAIGLSVATVKRDLRLAEAWLQRYFIGQG